MLARTPIIEEGAINDIFVTELAEIEYLGNGNFRCVFVAPARFCGKAERRVVTSLVLPADAIKAGIFKAARAIGLSIIGELTVPSTMEKRH